MKIFARLKAFVSGMIKCEDLNQCLLSKGTMKELEMRETIINSLSEELNEIDNRRRIADRRTDALKATVDGDEEWFLSLERKDGDKNDRCSL